MLRPNGTKSAKIIQVIETKSLRGIGTEKDPVRDVTQYWDLEGNFLEAEYNNGWIPCSERLPENISTVVIQVKEIKKPTFGWYGNMTGWRLTEKDFTELKDFIVVAWQPLPDPYHPKGE